MIKLTILSVVGVYLLWIFYLAVMNLKGARDAKTLGPIAYAMGVPTLVIGYILDFLINVIICTIAFRELPRETTVTARLKRHKDDEGSRGELARWIAAHLLDPFDPDGRHV